VKVAVKRDRAADRGLPSAPTEGRARPADEGSRDRLRRSGWPCPPTSRRSPRGDRVLESRPPGSFKIETRRGFKVFPLDSIAISRPSARHCVEATAARGRPIPRSWSDRGPEPHSYVMRRPARPGGMPPGSQGALLALLSGGIDSPVGLEDDASRRAQSSPSTSGTDARGNAVLEKLEDLCRSSRSRRATFPPSSCRSRRPARIVAPCPRAPNASTAARCFRIASKIALPRRALGYVTGDSLGQVASQTARTRSIHGSPTAVYSR